VGAVARAPRQEHQATASRCARSSRSGAELLARGCTPSNAILPPGTGPDWHRTSTCRRDALPNSCSCFNSWVCSQTVRRLIDEHRAHASRASRTDAATRLRRPDPRTRRRRDLVASPGFPTDRHGEPVRLLQSSAPRIVESGPHRVVAQRWADSLAGDEHASDSIEKTYTVRSSLRVLEPAAPEVSPPRRSAVWSVRASRDHVHDGRRRVNGMHELRCDGFRRTGLRRRQPTRATCTRRSTAAASAGRSRGAPPAAAAAAARGL